MSVIRRTWRRPTLLLSLVVAAVVMAGCAGPTSVSAPSGTAKYDVAVKMDPPTLNPPALGTLTFAVTNKSNGKPVTAFEPVDAALMHTIILRSDLGFFRHSTTDRVVLENVSVPSSFPTSGTYNVWSYFKPAKDDVQVYTMSVATGEASGPPKLVEDWRTPKISSGVTVTFLGAPDTWKAGTPVQMAFRVTERGYPVSSLWPYFGAAGHLWIADDAKEGTPILAHEIGASVSHLDPKVTPGTGSNENTISQFPNSAEIGGSDVKVPQAQVTNVPPTYAPAVANAIASITAQPVSTLLPVQQTAQSSVIGTPAVVPYVSYGPEVAFTHTFPHPGMYRMWAEFQYGVQVITVDFTVRVQ